jgi:hypothetical protein
MPMLVSSENAAAVHGPNANTIVVSVAELFAATGSVVVDETDAVFETGCAAVGVVTR